MDISSMLPLLMANKKGGDGTGPNVAELMQLMNNGGEVDKTELITKMMPKGSDNGNMAQILSMANSMKSKPNNNRPMGISPIKQFANNDIVGKLVKFFG